MKNQLHALILAGGQSSRMRKDKAFIAYHGCPQVVYLHDLLQRLNCKVHISVRQMAPELVALHYHIITDQIHFKDHGPISGLLSAIATIPAQNWLLIGCDYPYVNEQVLQEFLKFIDENPDLPAAFSTAKDSIYEPTLAYYPASIQEELSSHFYSKNDSLQSFLKSNGARSFIPEHSKDCKNINTVEQMLAAQLELSSIQPDLVQNKISLLRYDRETPEKVEDFVACEEPLEIRVSYPKNDQVIEKSIAITMRTPGQDEALACGFLFTEGIVGELSKVKKIVPAPIDSQTILIQLEKDGYAHNMVMDRQFYINSSCGICGKASIEAIKTKSPYPFKSDNLKVNSRIFMNLPQSIKKFQTAFGSTGGLHAASLFSADGDLLYLSEDVGRHNALDKLIGHCWLQGTLPLDSYILLLSGRGSFELIQKAYMAGCKIVACIGAPSSLAVELAAEMDMTLIGFLKEERMNVYSGFSRVE